MTFFSILYTCERLLRMRALKVLIWREHRHHLMPLLQMRKKEIPRSNVTASVEQKGWSLLSVSSLTA